MEVSATPIYNNESNISNVNGSIGETYSSDDDDIVRRHTQRKRNVRESDSDTENVDPTKTSPVKNVTKSRIRKISNSDSDSQEPTATENADPTKTSSIKNITKSRIRKINSDSDSQEPTTATYKSSRVENRKMKLFDKFKALGTPQVKSASDGSDSEHQKQRSDGSSEQSDEEVSCLKIKKKIMKKKNALSSICDADTSDEDVDRKLDRIKHQKKIKPKTMKSAIEIEPKMSAKQAMENMQKIKSESNRMLREKDVSLPYHKPRALSLHDIMKRKRPALTSDGKVMPIKMNNEQLAQYVKLLEERQKEIIELCKSDSEEEAVLENPIDKTTNIEDLVNTVDGNKQDLHKTSDNLYDTIMQETNNSSADISMENVSDNIQENKNDSEEAKSKEVNNEKLDLESGIGQKIQEDVDNKVKVSDVNADVSSLNSSSQDNETIMLKYLDSSTENVIEDIGNERNIEYDSTKPISDEQDTGAFAKVTNNSEALCQNYSNLDSQAISLKFDSEKILPENESKREDNSMKDNLMNVTEITNNDLEEKENDFSDDDDLNLDNIDTIIENAEIIKDNSNLDTTKPTATMPDLPTLKPKLTGSPGMFIDLETGNQQPRALTGVDLLKERFTYFSRLKTAEEMEKNRLQQHKPGLQHLKLKHELEEQIAAQRSLEWEKRLEEEKQLKSEMTLEPEDDIEKIESKLEDEEIKESSSSEEEELVEDDVEIKDVPRKSNPMIDDEAEESNEEDNDIVEAPENEDELEENANENESDNSSSDESSSESDDERTNKAKKGRILKAFEDSDDEINNEKQDAQIQDVSVIQENRNEVQDEEIQLAQFNRSISDDIFATQESQKNSISNTQDVTLTCDIQCTGDLGSQTFSILDSTSALNNKEKELTDRTLSVTQSIDESKFDVFNKNTTGSLSQNLLMSQPLSSQSQEIGDDIAALCTGKFYDNPFVTEVQDNENNLEEPLMVTLETNKSISQVALSIAENVENLNKNEENKQAKDNSTDSSKKLNLESNEKINNESEKIKPVEDGNLLKSILDELNEPEVEKTNRFFGAKQESQAKKRFVIDSDEEDGERIITEKVKKFKKRKPEKRALQISDDEEDEENLENDDEESEIEEDIDKVVEYDSEENEIEVQAKPVKKKRMGEFFENEAELTSEDEWVGSGDEDEAGLDRMEREEGDDEVFHQGQLQQELGEIHMREVLDQDKREVRLLQELLFEDGDLGDGHRQRKFRWQNNGDVDDGTGMGDIGLPDTQEEEFESEELWRKQRHERELFLKSLQENEDEKSNTTLNRTALIKANLNSIKKHNKDKNVNKIEAEVKPPVEPKTTKDLPSPKKQFLILKQSYHGSLLSRGQGALARLAALATPLAAEADAPRPKAATSAPGNFVFATLSQPDPELKVTKRKAETKADTPRLLKKMKTDETQKLIKNSLFDHFTT